MTGFKKRAGFMATCSHKYGTLEDLMQTIRYAHRQDGEFRLGYIEEYPDYMTQGMSLEKLRLNLADLYRDLVSGGIPCVRKVGKLQVA